ncbi:hypothetical protein Bbelb_162150 [Branchiostoma belcheri]|nr:hypothetical protein Bbelb_162150 [Branchiostoma belcheri]
MGRKLRCVLIFLLIILKEPNMPEGCRCAPSSACKCPKQGLTSIPQNLPTSITTLELEHQIICAHPARFQGQKLINVNPEEICEEPTISTLTTVDIQTSFKSTVSTSSVDNTCYEGTSYNWYIKRPKPSNIVGTNINTAVNSVMTSGDDNQFEDVDNLNDKTGQGQSQTITESTTNTTASVMTSGEDNQYEDIDNLNDKTGQGQSQAKFQSLKAGNVSNKVLAASKPLCVETQQNDSNSTSSHDQTGQGQSQTNTESNTNTTATVMSSGDDNQYEDIDKHHD